ncbi:MAG: hypothetical protein JWO82_2276 [Akkermansiaceae bacterium]|nr:hypothetical protein [Akkermansiaceae bacterium]
MPATPHIQTLAEGLFPRTVWVADAGGSYTRHDDWPYMVAAGNRCRHGDLIGHEIALCELLDGAHAGVRFPLALAVFLSGNVG